MGARNPTLAEGIVARCKVGQSRQVIVPRSVFDRLGLEEGDLIELVARRRQIVMRAKRRVSPDDTLGASEARKVRHGLKQIRQGKTRPWRAIKDELGL